MALLLLSCFCRVTHHPEFGRMWKCIDKAAPAAKALCVHRSCKLWAKKKKPTKKKPRNPAFRLIVQQRIPNVSIKAIKFSTKAHKDLKEDFGPASEEIMGPSFEVLLFDFHCAQPITCSLRSAPAKALQGSSTNRGEKKPPAIKWIFLYTLPQHLEREMEASHCSMCSWGKTSPTVY